MTLPQPGARILEALAEAADLRMHLVPDDVEAELAQLVGNPVDREGLLLLLVCRRMREVVNTLGRDISGLPPQLFDPAYMSAQDMLSRGIEPGALVTITSSHGVLLAVAAEDASVRAGVVSMTHCWGDSPKRTSTAVPAPRTRADLSARRERPRRSTTCRG